MGASVAGMALAVLVSAGYQPRVFHYRYRKETNMGLYVWTMQRAEACASMRHRPRKRKKYSQRFHVPLKWNSTFRLEEQLQSEDKCSTSPLSVGAYQGTAEKRDQVPGCKSLTMLPGEAIEMAGTSDLEYNFINCIHSGLTIHIMDFCF